MVHSVIRKPFDIEVLSDLVTAAAKSVADDRSAGESGAVGQVVSFPRRRVPSRLPASSPSLRGCAVP